MTSRSAVTLVLAAILGAASPAVAETTYLPGAAEGPGLAGARFSSTLELSNPGGAGAMVTIGLVPMTGKTAPAPVTRTLAAGESLRIPEALKSLFGLSDGAAGTITVTTDELLLASLSTRNVAAPEGPYGLGLLPVSSSELLGAGETGHSIWVSQSADRTTGYRTNLSVTLADPGSVVEVRVLDAGGRVAGSATVTAAGPEVWQQPLTALVGTADLPVGRAEFEVKAGRATAYAVVNDNVTSDAIALQTERVAPGATDRLISGAALSPGHLGSFWVTDLRLFNPGSAAVEATIQSVGASREASAVVPVPARGVVEVARVLALLGFPEGTACALRVKAGGSLLVAARTNNVDPAGVRKGTFSAQQFVTSWPAGLLGAGTVGFFNGVDQTLNVPGVRTNLTLVGGPEGATGELILRDAAGVERGRKSFNRGPGEWGQLGAADWFAASLSSPASLGGLAAATIPENARIDVSVGSGALDAFVSRIDNGSGDAVTRPVALPGGGDCSKIAIAAFGASPQPVKAGVTTTFTWTVALDPPTSELTSQSIQFDGEPQIDLGKDVRSFARSFTSAGPRSVALTVRKGSCVKTRTLAFFVCAELVLDPVSLPDGIAFAVYPIRQITAQGATPPSTFAVTAGALPRGVILSSAGEVSGRPLEIGLFTFTVEAVDSNGCQGRRDYTIRVFCPTLRISPTALAGGTVGAPYGPVQMTVSGGSGSGTWSATGLPAGLSLSVTGQLSGTPTAAGSYAVSVRFRDSSGCEGTAPYTIVICNTLVAGPGTVPAGTAGLAYGPVTFTATGATGATTWAVTAGSLPAGLTLNPGTGVLSGTPTVVGTFPITVTATDSLGCTGSVAVSLVVSCPTITVNPASLANGTAGVAYGPLSLSQTGGLGTVTYGVTAGALPAGMSLAASGTLSGTPTVVGPFSFTVTATDANGCTGTRAYTLTIDCPAITVSPASLPNGTAGSAYAATFTQTGGVGAATWAVTAGAPPSGVTLSPAGLLSGTPTATGTFSFTVTATDANGCTGARALTLVVDCPVITVNPATLPGATVGTFYSQTVSSSGGIGASTFAVSAGSLPTGLTLSAGTISGTPTAAGTYGFTITATDANGCTGSRAYTVVATCPAITLSPGTLPGGTTGVAYSQGLSASGGTAAYTFAVTAGAPPPGVTLAGSSLSGTPTAAGTYGFTITATDANGCTGTRAYTLTIVCPTITVGPATLPGGTVGTAYSQTVTGAGGGGTYLYTVVPGTLPAGLALNGASGTITGTPTTAGLFTFTITATDQYGCSGGTAYSVRICPVVTVTPASAPQATINQPYGPVAFSQTGGVGPIAWSATGLPAGLSIDSTGEISGTPTAAGGFPVTVTATDANGCPGSVTFTLRVCPAMSITPASLANATVGSAYGPVTFVQTGSAAPITWSATGLPATLTLNPTTGELSGTPDAPGTFPVVVTATDSNGCSVSRGYTLVVDCPAISLSPASLPGASAGTAYNQGISASSALVGGSYAFAVVSGTLPAGLSLSGAGALTGSATAVGTFGFTIRATHSPTGCTGDQAYSITVSCGTITVGGGAPPTNVTAGVAGYTHTFSASGGVGPHTFSSTGTLPTGLTLSPAGVLSGTPTAAGTFSFTIVATDSATGATCTGSAPFTVVVVCPAITVNPATLPSGTEGTAYSQSVTATGGTGSYTFAVTAGSLPTGLSLSGAGAITGTSTAAGSFSFTITATDTVTSCTGSRAYTVRICPVIDLSAVATCTTVGAAYSSTITASAGAPAIAFTVTAGSVPPGLILTSAGVLSGTPTTAGQFPFTVTATDANGCTGSRAYSVNVLDLAPAAGALPDATFGTAYSRTFTGTGGSGAFTYARTAGAFPSWLSLDPGTGVLGGTPAGADGTGSFSFTITATNTATGCTVSKAYTLVSRPVAVNNTYGDGAGNTEYYAGGFTTPATPFVSSATNILTNDLGPGLTAALVTGPANGTVTLNPNGSFRFTPTAPAQTSATFTYRVTSNGVDSASNATVTITLNGLVWYVNSSGSNGSGTSSSPFNTMSSADSASPASSSVVFVHTGAATTPGTISLAADQTLWGQGTTFTLSGLTIPGGSKPTLSGTVTIGGNNVTVSSVDLSTGTATGITNTGTVTGVTVKNDVVVTTTTGTAVSFSNLSSTAGGAPSFGVNFRSVSANGAANGISLTNVNTTAGTFTVTGSGTAASGGTIQNAGLAGVAMSNVSNVSFDRVVVRDTGRSGISGTQVTNFTFTNGSIDNSGTSGGVDDSNLAFNGNLTGTDNNLAGIVTITGNTLTNAFGHGIDILSFAGTLSDVTISSNTLTSSTSTASSKGSGVRLQALGSATTVSNVTKATISSNVISNFPSGAGIQALGGNSNAAGPVGTFGTSGSATNVITIGGNRIQGQSAANRMGTSAIIATVSGKGQAGFEITGNGTAVNPLTNTAGTTILCGTNGNTTSTFNVADNVIVANNTVASNGIGGGTGITFGTTDTPSMTWTITNNSISAVDGNGILAVARGATGTLRAKIQNNAVAAPLTGVRPGIRVDAGNASSLDDSVCLNISGNTSAGSGGTQGIGLRKQGTVTTTNDFGVNGMAATSTPGVEAYIDSLNPAGGGTLLISATSGFSNCSFP